MDTFACFWDTLAAGSPLDDPICSSLQAAVYFEERHGGNEEASKITSRPHLTMTVHAVARCVVVVLLSVVVYPPIEGHLNFVRTIHNTHADLIRANVLRVRNYYSTVNLVVLSKLINYTDKQALNFNLRRGNKW